MKREEKEKHLRKVQTFQLHVKQLSSTATQPHNTHLSVPVENDAAGLSSVSFSTLTSMCKKAENLILVF